MSQTTYYQMANEPGAPFRQHLNETIAALNSDFAGTVAPTTPVANMTWLDTSLSPAMLKRRNTANSAWVPAYSQITGKSMTANQVLYCTGLDTYDVMTVSSAARAVLDDSSGAAMLTTMGGANLNSPSFTGTPTAPTAGAGNNSTQIATTAYVATAVANIPAAVDAQTWQKGIVQLEDSVGSTSTTKAATPNSARVAYDRGSQGVNDAAYALSVANSSAVTLSHVAGTGTGGVGSYALLTDTTGNSHAPGTTFAGGTMAYCSGGAYHSNVYVSGTWRCMGQVTTDYPGSTLWLRIS